MGAHHVGVIWEVASISHVTNLLGNVTVEIMWAESSAIHVPLGTWVPFPVIAPKHVSNAFVMDTQFSAGLRPAGTGLSLRIRLRICTQRRSGHQPVK